MLNKVKGMHNSTWNFKVKEYNLMQLQPILTPDGPTSTQFTYAWRTEGWVDLGGSSWYTEMFTYPSSNHLIATRPESNP